MSLLSLPTGRGQASGSESSIKCSDAGELGPVQQDSMGWTDKAMNIEKPLGDPLDEITSRMDHQFHGWLAGTTAGLSPMALGAAYADWAGHLAVSPGKQIQLLGKAARKWLRFSNVASASFSNQHSAACIDPLPQDKRFSRQEWENLPFFLIVQAFLFCQQWWHNAMTGVPGVDKQHEKVVAFSTRQLLDVFAPSNSIFTNPVVQRKISETGGFNLLQGAANYWDDCRRLLQGMKPAGAEAFQVGRNIAITPGKVIYRNKLIELIQYEPQTEKVVAEPILIVPAWIMKYYILDLSPQNSLVRHLVSHGFTVFIISWRNPTEAEREIDMDDYRKLGIMEAIKAISAIVPGRKIHAAGYCLGGTLLAIAAASMARDKNSILQTMSLFAAQTDFTEAGELTLFINESQVTFLEELMRSQGFLDSTQMAGAFQILRSNDLIWSKIIHDYLMGERSPMTDLMAWNADATRMPCRMHSEYLRRLFLDNDLAEGHFKTDGHPIALNEIHVPVFAVGTEYDHVAPWRSVFKLHTQVDSEITFVLAGGGHNSGIVADPSHPGRSYKVRQKVSADPYIDPDEWVGCAEQRSGSWWLEWADWLVARSNERTSPPTTASEKGDYRAL